MTATPRYPVPNLKICPYCLNTLDWSDYSEVPLVKESSEGPEELTRAPGESEARWLHRTLGAMRQCRGDGGPHGSHLLPVDYGELDPLIIGLVGASAAGKTHLLTSMIAQLERRKAMLAPELRIEPLDGRMRQRFYDERIRPFLERREVLPGTRRGRAEFVYALRVTSEFTGRTHAVGFFDVAGEHFSQHEYDDTPFMSLADGVIYVADGDRLKVGDSWNPWVPDPGFTHAIAQMSRTRGTSDGRLPPAVIVVAKSDVLDGLDDDTVTRWLRQHDESGLADLRSIKQESQDAYTFLRRHGAELWLEPFHSGSVTTIHFASASGVARRPDEKAGTFPIEGFGPRRVLRPLLSLFSLAGLVPKIVLDEPDAPLDPLDDAPGALH